MNKNHFNYKTFRRMFRLLLKIFHMFIKSVKKESPMLLSNRLLNRNTIPHNLN